MNDATYAARSVRWADVERQPLGLEVARPEDAPDVRWTRAWGLVRRAHDVEAVHRRWLAGPPPHPTYTIADLAADLAASDAWARRTFPSLRVRR